MDISKNNREYNIYLSISKYLTLKYPEIKFHFDFGSGVKLTKLQAYQQSVINPQKGYPDLIILKPKGKFHALFLEIKSEGKTPYTKQGEMLANEHLENQREYLGYLLQNGYCADFAVGLDECLSKIDKYLSLPDHIKF